jgi:hypothetical protein
MLINVEARPQVHYTFLSTFYVPTHTKKLKDSNNKVRICSYYLLHCISSLVEIECPICFSNRQAWISVNLMQNHVATATLHHSGWL